MKIRQKLFWMSELLECSYCSICVNALFHWFDSSFHIDFRTVHLFYFQFTQTFSLSFSLFILSFTIVVIFSVYGLYVWYTHTPTTEFLLRWIYYTIWFLTRAHAHTVSFYHLVFAIKQRHKNQLISIHFSYMLFSFHLFRFCADANFVIAIRISLLCMPSFFTDTFDLQNDWFEGWVSFCLQNA